MRPARRWKLKLSDLFTPEEFARHSHSQCDSDDKVERIGTGILPYSDALAKYTSMTDEMITCVCMTLALADSLLESKNESKSIN